MNETDRIKAVYQKRDAFGKRQLYSLFNPASLYAEHRREEEILKLFSRNGTKDLSSMRILDLGCGNGGVLRNFIRYGALPENCCGIDLLQTRIDEAKRLSPTMEFRCLNGETLPFADAAFDMVLCFTVLTSILDGQMKRNIAAEMLRVLKPGGAVLWYDYHMNNPNNPDVRGVNKTELVGLFPGCAIQLKRITLAPPFTRAVAPFSWILCALLEKLKVLNTHYLGLIRKPT
jgi:ubiquinone/menaquinone biosynthesis C-methylase UbiE